MNGKKIKDAAVSVVVPVYNSACTLESLVEKLQEVLSKICSQYEVIMVNDGSVDNSWEVICHLAEKHSWVRGIGLMRNYGQHNAILCGVRDVRLDLIVTIDDDLQNPPEEIPKLLDKLDEGYDVVYGTPKKKQHGFWRDMASVITKLALKSAMGAGTARNVSAFRIFRTHLRDAFKNYQSPFLSIDVLLTWGTTRFGDVPVHHNKREAGQSNYTFLKLVTHAFNMMTGFSILPLQVANFLGFGFTVFGMFVLIYVLLRYLIHGDIVPGFPFLASIIAIFSGVQLFSLGIIGEYLSRMHFRLMERPTYVVNSRLEKDPIKS